MRRLYVCKGVRPFVVGQGVLRSGKLDTREREEAFDSSFSVCRAFKAWPNSCSCTPPRPTCAWPKITANEHSGPALEKGRDRDPCSETRQNAPDNVDKLGLERRATDESAVAARHCIHFEVSGRDH